MSGTSYSRFLCPGFAIRAVLLSVSWDRLPACHFVCVGRAGSLSHAPPPPSCASAILIAQPFSFRFAPAMKCVYAFEDCDMRLVRVPPAGSAVCFGQNAGSPPPAASLILVRDQQPAASIVVAQEPTRAASLAAHELQYHVALITGAKLPIVTDDVAVQARWIWSAKVPPRGPSA